MIDPKRNRSQQKNGETYTVHMASTTIEAMGEGLTYQWYGRDPGQEDFWRSRLKGDTYSVTMVPAKSGRQVCCVVTDKYGNSVTSETATLRMAQAAVPAAAPAEDSFAGAEPAAAPEEDPPADGDGAIPAAAAEEEAEEPGEGEPDDGGEAQDQTP